LRRMLFVLVLSYMVSSWMVNFEYRPTFFMFAGAIAALHRHLHGLITKDPVENEEPLTGVLIPAWKVALLPQPQPALAGPASSATDTDTAQATTTDMTPIATASAKPEDKPSPPPAPVSRIGRGWNRIGLIDLGATVLMVKALVRFWAYAMTKM